MYRVLFDTSVWLEIAKNTKRFVELAIVETMVRRGAVQLIVPPLAIKEFQNNRANLAHKAATELKPHAAEVRKAAIAIGGSEKKVAAFLEHLTYLTGEVPLDGGRTNWALDRIEKLLRAAPVVAQPDSALKAAVRRGLEKKAPFHGRNGMADALLIETYAHCVSENEDPDIRFAFITHDEGDFGNTRGDKNLPHPDLEEVFPIGKSYFFINVVAALNQINSSIVSEVQAREEPTFGQMLSKCIAATKPTTPSVHATWKMLMRMPISEKKLSKLRPSDYVDHCRLRSKTVKPPTILNDMGHIAMALKWAQTNMPSEVSFEGYELGKREATKEGLIAKSGVPVLRRLTEIDEQRLLARFNRPPKKVVKNRVHMAPIFQFGLWSARRLEQICQLRWEDFDERTGMCKVRDVYKTGKPLDFRIVGKALEAVQMQKEISAGEERIFPYKAKSVGKLFRDAKDELQIAITFDELCDEGVRRMIEAKYPPETIVEVAGDADWVFQIRKELDTAAAQLAATDT